MRARGRRNPSDRSQHWPNANPLLQGQGSLSGIVNWKFRATRHSLRSQKARLAASGLISDRGLGGVAQYANLKAWLQTLLSYCPDSSSITKRRAQLPLFGGRFEVL